MGTNRRIGIRSIDRIDLESKQNKKKSQIFYLFCDKYSLTTLLSYSNTTDNVPSVSYLQVLLLPLLRVLGLYAKVRLYRVLITPTRKCRGVSTDYPQSQKSLYRPDDEGEVGRRGDPGGRVIYRNSHWILSKKSWSWIVSKDRRKSVYRRLRTLEIEVRQNQDGEHIQIVMMWSGSVVVEIGPVGVSENDIEGQK